MRKFECEPVETVLDELNEYPVYLNHHYATVYGDPQFHYHRFIEMCFVESGGGYHQIRDSVIPCKKGDLYIINSGVPHSYFLSEEMKYTEFLMSNLIFLPEFLINESTPDSQLLEIYNNFSTEIMTEDTSVIKLSMDEGQFKTVQHLYKSIKEEYENRRNGSTAIIRANITILLVTIARFVYENSDSTVKYTKYKSPFTMVQEACRIIEDSYGNPNFNINVVAENLYIGKSYLSRIFKKYMNQYFSEYVLTHRMEKAAEMLRESTLTNEQICQTCGLKDIPTFYRNFKTYFGCTPKEYSMKYKQRNTTSKNSYMAEQK